MKYVIIFLLIFFLPLLVNAETTFFDQDDLFFISNSGNTNSIISGGATAEITGEAVEGSVCVYKWNCTNWGECFPSGERVRNCTNLGTCPDTYNSPNVVQICTYTDFNIEEEKESKLVIFLVAILIISIAIIYVKRDYFRKMIIRKY